MATKSSITDIDAQIEKLRERRRSMIAKSAERFARAAMKSKIAEMEIADEEVDHIFEELATRFRKEQKRGVAHAAASPRRQPRGGIGAAAEVSHDG
ncbi:pilus assembly protein [Phyllobacterium salinisoli]|uniref:Pilus assembly protein n=1 Tax=Phyllobacterium salinisoli TaxID=1899321 RepID=A0A368K0U7_9HYPH|nr:TraC family protein [Phyllobacterium salinisoli]RCS22794.1 pilus assembly protein [Phyllobacterium salinisoli]